MLEKAMLNVGDGAGGGGIGDGGSDVGAEIAVMKDLADAKFPLLLYAFATILCDPSVWKFTVADQVDQSPGAAGLAVWSFSESIFTFTTEIPLPGSEAVPVTDTAVFVSTVLPAGGVVIETMGFVGFAA
jgi:hypothetical protein